MSKRSQTRPGTDASKKEGFDPRDEEQAVPEEECELPPNSAKTGKVDRSISRSPRGTFFVHGEKEPLAPITSRSPGSSSRVALEASGNAQAVDTHSVLLSPAAWGSVVGHIGWGRDTKQNQVEQGGLLVGWVYREAEREVLSGYVKQAVPGRLAEGSMSYLSLNHATWHQMLRAVDAMADELPEGDPEPGVIGWYHTHPRHLSVFMSGVDRATQQRFFDQDWHFAIVLNPQKRVWRVFRGPLARECRGFVLEEPP